MFQRNLLTVLSTVTLMLASTGAMAQNSAGSSGGGGSSAAASDAGGYTERIGSVNGRSTASMRPKSLNVARAPGQIESKTHDVVEGDTLWDLSSTYLSDPFMWPQLWSYNPQISNPHWIYPGDVICIEPCTQEAAELTTVPEPTPDFDLGFVAKMNARGAVIVPGYYVSELPETRGHVLFSPHAKHLLATGDEVQVDWIDMEMRKKVSVGQKFTVFKQSKPVLNDDGDPMAYKLVRLGAIELVDVNKDSLSTARIIQASREIERGDMIIPNNDLIFGVKNVKNTKSQEGRILDTIDLTNEMGENQFVIINRGTEDGVVPGNRWIVFEQREGLDLLERGSETHSQYATEKDKSYDEDDDNRDMRDGEIEREEEYSWVLGHEPQTPNWPKKDELEEYEDREYTTDDLPLRKIGEVLVIDARDKYCTGLIMDSQHEVQIDTRVVMINGY